MNAEAEPLGPRSERPTAPGPTSDGSAGNAPTPASSAGDGHVPVATTPNGTEPRFPGFDVRSQAPAWDEVTRGVVLARLAPRGSLGFFDVSEEPTVRALVDRLLAQDAEPRVPVAEMIDDRLLRGQGDGYRHHDMPEDREAWRRSITGLDRSARRRHGRPFWDLPASDQMALIEGIRLGDGDWCGMPASKVFGLWLRYCCDAFYAHPLAWNEIGFGGPAYPRGYKNIGLDRREPWEVRERRPVDPIPWVERAEAARRRHAEQIAPADGPSGSETHPQPEPRTAAGGADPPEGEHGPDQGRRVGRVS